MRGARDSRRVMYVKTDVFVAYQGRFACMQAHADPEALAAGQSELARFAHDGAIGAGQPRPRGCLAESAPVTRRTCDCGPAQAAGATAASDASAWTKR